MWVFCQSLTHALSLLHNLEDAGLEAKALPTHKEHYCVGSGFPSTKNMTYGLPMDNIVPVILRLYIARGQQCRHPWVCNNQLRGKVCADNA